MERKVGLIIDSTFGLEPQYVKSNKITVVPLKIIIDHQEYIDGEINPQLIVDAMHKNKEIKTSQPSPELFMNAFEEQFEMYPDVICLTLSKTLSGTVNSANLGATLVESTHAFVVDTKSTISGSGYIAQKMVEFLDLGHTIEEGLVYLEELIKKGSLIFTVNDLQTLVKGGRLNRVQAVIGNLLKIKPILRFNQGVLDIEHKVRSYNNVYVYLTNEVKKLMEKGKVVVYISYVDRSTEAKLLEHEIYQLGENVKVAITGVISPVISAHIGLGGLGIYLANE
ncbi:MAG: DegV family protein [Acholeplasmataceae bacterium]|nr:DegV family protein [Acholeplasmataceae bacterium]